MAREMQIYGPFHFHVVFVEEEDAGRGAPGPRGRDGITEERELVSHFHTLACRRRRPEGEKGRHTDTPAPPVAP